MSERDGIQSFLAAVRRRLLLRAGLQAAGYGAAALGIGLFVLGLSAASVGPADFWPTVTACFAGVLGLVVLARGVLVPARALRDDRAAARRTGALLPEMASDLLSAVELAGAPAADARGGASPALVRAFREQVARGLAPVAPARLVSFGPATRALAVSGLIAAALIAAMALWPTVARGLRTLLHHPSRFEGAADLRGAAGRRRARHLRVSRLHRPRLAHRRGLDRRHRGGQGDARSHRDPPAAPGAPRAPAAR